MAEIAQREYYNRIAKEYDAHHMTDSALRYRYGLRDRIFRNIDLSGANVLDAMCGGGGSTGYYLLRGAKVTGLDISKKCCELYSQRYRMCNVVCSSILRTGFPDSHFDVVVAGSLHHLHPHLDQAMDEIHRILKPDGYLFCTEPTARSIVDVIRKAWYKLDRKYFLPGEKSIDMDELIRARENQYEVVKKIYGGNIAYLFVNQSMGFRVPIRLVEIYGSAFIAAESFLNRFQSRFISCWVYCLLRKKGVLKSS